MHKIANRFRYADSFDGEFVGVSVELSLTEDIGAKDFSEPRERSPSAETGRGDTRGLCAHFCNRRHNRMRVRMAMRVVFASS